jgi:hypothetical protein
MPALLNNSSRPLIHLRHDPKSALAPYLSSRALAEEEQRHRQLRSFGPLTTAIAGSGCDRVGIANWILFEYPLWAGLRDQGWGGRITDVDVANQSTRYQESDFRPCALVRQVENVYVSQDNGMVGYRFGSLALSVDPGDLGSVAPPPGFVSDEPSLSVYPGAGWSLGDGGPTAFVAGAELYLRSQVGGVATVRIQLTESPRSRLSSSEADQVRVSATEIVLRVRLDPGITRVSLKQAGGPQIQQQVSGVVARLR